MATPLPAGLNERPADGLSIALTRLAHAAMTGVSVLALSLGMAALATGSVQAQDDREVIDGDAAGGYLITGSGVYSTAGTQGFVTGADLDAIGVLSGSTLTVTDKVITNFVTHGGAGSGGGAGLGGAFFVDSGASLILNNVDFTTNTVNGGAGGSKPAVDVGSIGIGLASLEFSLIPINSFGVTPGVTGSGTTKNDFTVKTFKLPQKNTMLKAGMQVFIPGADTPVEIESVSADFTTVTLKGSGATLTDETFYGGATWNVLNAASGQDWIKFDDADVRNLKVGGTLVLNGQIQEGVYIKSIDYNSGKVTFTDALPPGVISAMHANYLWSLDNNDPDGSATAPNFDFINLVDFEASQVKNVSGNTIILASPNPMLEKGMVLTGEGLPAEGVVIKEINGDTLTIVDQAGANYNVPAIYKFDAKLAAVTVLDDDTTRVLTTKTGLAKDMLVSGDGVPSGTVIKEVGDGYVILDQKLGNIDVNNLSFSAIKSASGNVVTVANKDLVADVFEGMLVSGTNIPAGTTVVHVNKLTGEVELSSDVDGLVLADLYFGDPKAQGGSLNNVNQKITGTTGYDGVDGVPPSPITGDGEGSDGAGGGPGGDGTTDLPGTSVVGAGGTGGQGGNGSDAMGHNPALIKEVTWNTITAVSNTAQFVASLIPEGAPIPVPDAADAVPLAVDVATSYVDLAFSITDLVQWQTYLAEGRVAWGGSGGDGGDGGAGGEFAGGGAGGNGGDGGDAGRPSVGVGGDGGDGGSGGDGGFGSGGGMGGAGGTGGAGRSNDGDGGAGGEGGFGAGDGSNGDGRKGEGGDGFGGAIFVRDGGSLTINGNAIFYGNDAAGGTSTNGGKAGVDAGTDLFMMRGSTINITPGAGNVVTFNGTIGDDSQSSHADFSNGKGYGAGLTIGSGLTVFNGVNTYSGQTQIVGGALEAHDGVNINSYSNINFAGDGRTGTLSEANAGVLLTSGNFVRELGSGEGQQNRVQWTGSGGFAALGGNLTVNLGAIPGSSAPPKTLTWGATNGFFSTIPDAEAALVFGSELADHAVYFLNNINLNGEDRQIVVAHNESREDTFAVASGIISNGGLIVGDTVKHAAYDGMLILRGKNTYADGTDVRSGILVVDGAGTLGAAGSDVTVGPDGILQIMNEQDLGEIENDGAVVVAGDLEADSIDNGNLLVMAADITLSGEFVNDGHLLVLGNPPDDTTRTLTTSGFSGADTGKVTIGGTNPEEVPPILDETTTFAIYQTGTTGTTYAGVIEGAGAFSFDGVAGAQLTLTGDNDYTGATSIASGVTVALAGQGNISESASVKVDGTFDISDVDTDMTAGTAGPKGTLINDLGGAATGKVVLGDNLLVVDNAASNFAGVISGAGDVAIKAGTQTLSGVNTYTGETYVLHDAALKLVASDPNDPNSEDGSIADSVRVVVEGEFDISGTNNGAEIKGLEGGVSTAKVTLGDERLTITDANASDTISPSPVGTSFAGVISGTGGVTVEKGRQTLTNVNDYTGTTIVGPDGELYLVGSGGIAESESVTVDGVFDITGTTAGAEIIKLLGTDPDAKIHLGDETLTLTGDGDSSYAGIIDGTTASGLTIEDGTLTLTKASPDFDGTTTIAEDATLFLEDDGSITGSTVALAGTFDISGITTPNAIPGLTPVGTSVFDLSGDGEVKLGANTLAVSHATGDTFSGPVTGTGAFGVSGGLLKLDLADEPTVNATIFAATGGKALLTGGTIDTTDSDRSALAVVNGGVIETNDVTLKTDATHPTASVLFDAGYNIAMGPASVTLGAGTVLENGEPENRGPLLVVNRSGGGSELGDVEFIIDNSGTVVGDILDLDAVRATGMGGTNVRISEGVDWSGRVVAADFYVEAGASADFHLGSVLDNLTAEGGALLNSVTGNLNILGTFTINGNGTVSPGASPGAVNTNKFIAVNPAYVMQVKFGQPNPLPGSGNQYDQINAESDFTGAGGVGPGELGILLERWDSTQSDEVVDLKDIELLRIGGVENAGSDVYLARRFTQNGQELQLDRRDNRIASDTTLVVGTAETEQEFFGPGELIVYGLKSIVQDETYGLATLTGTAHQAGIETLGTFLERRGTGVLETTWGRAGVVRTEVNDTVDNTQDLAYGQYGVDLVQMGDLRAGVLGSYSASNSGVETETGTAGLQGNVFSGGAYATWDNGNAYIDAIGQYGFGDWTFSPTAASALTITSHTGLAALEAGFRLGDDQASVTPWGQLVYQTSVYDGLSSDWVANADFVDNSSLYVRGGVRAEAKFGIFAPYLDMGVSYDVNEQKTVTVDGFDQSTGMGGPRVELGAGFQADLSDSATIWSQVKGAYAQGDDTGVVGYQGQAGMRVSW